MQAQHAPQRCQSCGVGLVAGGVICPNCKQHYYSPRGVVAVTWGTRFAAWLLDLLLIVITLGIGWLIWALIVFANGQTPGKALLGIRAIKVSGAPSTWGYTFLREFVIKFLVIGVINWLTLGIFWLINYLWPLWDRNLQALHDKMIGTLVVAYHVPAATYQQTQPGDPWAGGGRPTA
jgi:uncharacterized RDD family membrane protein YckC